MAQDTNLPLLESSQSHQKDSSSAFHFPCISQAIGEDFNPAVCGHAGATPGQCKLSSFTMCCSRTWKNWTTLTPWHSFHPTPAPNYMKSTQSSPRSAASQFTLQSWHRNSPVTLSLHGLTCSWNPSKWQRGLALIWHGFLTACSIRW